MAMNEPKTLTTKAGIALLTAGGYLSAMALGGMNYVDTTGARWLWGLMLWGGLLLMAWAILAPWGPRPAKAPAPESAAADAAARAEPGGRG